MNLKSIKENSSMISNIIFIGNARCFHTMDWYRSAQRLLEPRKVFFATDLIDSEGHTKIVQASDCIINLFNIDRILFKRQSYLGYIWRNLVKTIMVPIQVILTRNISKKYPNRQNLIFHAHTMYYMWVCWMAGVKYIGTPQGSEVLVRPKKSFVYKFFAKKAILAAAHITVDSINMRDEIKRLCGKEALIIQNGIDISAITKRINLCNENRKHIVSIRILHQNYRIDKIFEGRVNAGLNLPLTFIYPQWDEKYKKSCFQLFGKSDEDLGRLPRSDLYDLLAKTKLVISIPISDSSPRSIYEAIFCGCCVAVTYNPWIDKVPECMRSRIHIVDLNNKRWFFEAVNQADLIVRKPYEPSEQVMNMFDQVRSMDRVIKLCYNN